MVLTASLHTPQGVPASVGPDGSGRLVASVPPNCLLRLRLVQRGHSAVRLVVTTKNGALDFDQEVTADVTDVPLQLPPKHAGYILITAQKVGDTQPPQQIEIHYQTS